MSRKISLIILLFIVLISVVFAAGTVIDPMDNAKRITACLLKLANDIGPLAALAMFLMGGITYLTAAEDSKQRILGKKFCMFGIIGIASIKALVGVASMDPPFDIQLTDCNTGTPGGITFTGAGPGALTGSSGPGSLGWSTGGGNLSMGAMPTLVPVGGGIDWRNVNGQDFTPSVKDQDYTGTCWAHAILLAMEMTFRIQNYGGGGGTTVRPTTTTVEVPTTTTTIAVPTTTTTIPDTGDCEADLGVGAACICEGCSCDEYCSDSGRGNELVVGTSDCDTDIAGIQFCCQCDDGTTTTTTTSTTSTTTTTVETSSTTTTTSPPPCADSDGGANYNVSGEVTQSYAVYSDCCPTATELMEFSCSADDLVKVESVTCTDGCVDGACTTGDVVTTTTTVVEIPPTTTLPPAILPAPSMGDCFSREGLTGAGCVDSTISCEVFCLAFTLGPVVTEGTVDCAPSTASSERCCECESPINDMSCRVEMDWPYAICIGSAISCDSSCGGMEWGTSLDETAFPYNCAPEFVGGVVNRCCLCEGPDEGRVAGV